MLNLFYAPGACSMSTHVILEETKIPYKATKIGWDNSDTGKQEMLKHNPIGAVPTLLLDDGKVLTQNLAILEYIADQKPEANLLGKPGTYERADILRWTSFVSSDLHKSFGPLFAMERISTNKETQIEIKNWAFANIERYLSCVEKQLQDKQFLAADHFTIADAYLFTVVRWTNVIKFSLDKFPAVKEYQARISQRPSVLAVMDNEGLLK